MGVVGAGTVIAAVLSSAIPWRALALLGVLWTMWVFGAQLHDMVFAPLGRLVLGQLSPATIITLEEEIADLEARLALPDLPARSAILAGIRLAEIYRERLFDKPRADLLLDRLLVKYPHSSELRIARRLPLEAQASPAPEDGL